MKTGTLALAVLLFAGAEVLGAQNPVQPVLAACPRSDDVFSERQVQVAARFVGDSSRSPRPTIAGTQSPNVVEFVVDTLGAPEPKTLVRIRVTDSALVQRAAAGLSKWQYRPAVATGCKVRQRVVAALQPDSQL